MKIATLCAAILLSGCSTPEQEVAEAKESLSAAQRQAEADVKEAAREGAEQVADARQDLAEKNAKATRQRYTYLQRAEFDSVIKRELSQLDAELVKLEERAKKADANARTKVEVVIADLKVARASLAKEAERSTQVKVDEWNEFQDSVNKGVTDFQKDVQEAIASLDEPS